MATELTAATGGEIMEQVLLKGDLSKLTPEERASYYMKVCSSVGFNPLTRPLEYITLNGKLTLYARKDATDQLRKLNGISIKIISEEMRGDLFIVKAHARDKTGREDEDLGAVMLGQLKGEAQANAILKAVTKAKRRVTLSISGMGFLDETEVDDIPADVKQPPMAPKAGNGFRIASTPPVPTPGPTDDAIHADDPFNSDPDTGEIPSTLDSLMTNIDAMAGRNAPDDEFVSWWRTFRDDIAKLDAKQNAALRAHFTAKRPGNKPKLDPAAAAGAA